MACGAFARSCPQSKTGNAANGFYPVLHRKGCTRCFADHTNRANGSPLIKSLFRPPPKGRACYCRQFSACWILAYPSCTEQDATPAFVHARVGLRPYRPNTFPPTRQLSHSAFLLLKCHLSVYGAELPTLVHIVAVMRRRPPFCLLGIRLCPGCPIHFHPARFQSRWCTHKPTSTGMARLSVTAHHNLPHSILKGCRYRLKLSSDLPGLRPEVPTSPDFSSTP